VPLCGRCRCGTASDQLPPNSEPNWLCVSLGGRLWIARMGSRTIRILSVVSTVAVLCFRSHARFSKATEATSGPRTASAARCFHSGFRWQRRKRGEWRRTAINGAGQRKTWGIFLPAVVPFKECTFALLQKSARLQPVRSPLASSRLARAIVAENFACRRSWARFKESGVGRRRLRAKIA
jgi:hypothetical protein